MKKIYSRLARSINLVDNEMDVYKKLNKRILNSFNWCIQVSETTAEQKNEDNTKKSSNMKDSNRDSQPNVAAPNKQSSTTSKDLPKQLQQKAQLEANINTNDVEAALKDESKLTNAAAVNKNEEDKSSDEEPADSDEEDEDSEKHMKK